MASVTATLTDFKVKLELQLKQEIKKLEDTKEVDDKLKEIREEFNQSTSFIEASLQNEIATIHEHTIHNEQYNRKNSLLNRLIYAKINTHMLDRILQNRPKWSKLLKILWSAIRCISKRSLKFLYLFDISSSLSNCSQSIKRNVYVRRFWARTFLNK